MTTAAHEVDLPNGHDVESRSRQISIRIMVVEPEGQSRFRGRLA